MPVVIVPMDAKLDKVVTAVLTNVPDVGKVTEVLAVAVIVVVNAPEVVKLPPNDKEPVPNVKLDPEPLKAVVVSVPVLGLYCNLVELV